MSILSSPADAGGSILDPIQATIKNPFSTTVKNGGERGKDFPSGFQIIEYVNGVAQNGTNGAKSTVIRLVGNMMPFQPFPWSGEQRLVKDYYPGNPEAAVHVMGAKEGDLVIKGRFKDKRYRDPAYYGVSYQMAELVDAMRKRGNLVKFGMHGTAGDWFRWGFIEKVDFKMNKLSWVEYEISFSVVSDKQPINDYFAATEKQAPTGVNANLINAATAFQQNYSTVPKSMPLSISDVMNGLISDVAKNINLVTNFVTTITDTIQSVESSAIRALGLIRHCKTQMFEFQQKMDNITHAFSRYSASGNNKAQASDLYSNLSFIISAISDVHPIQRSLAQMEAQFTAIAKQIPKARHRVVQGDTLQKVSVKYYGTADNWTKIQDHNNLQTTSLTQGQILEIPNV